jgi:hypothetical protein
MPILTPPKMEMQTDNPRLPYTDPTADPSSGLSPESVALSGASDAGDVSRIRSILSSLPPETSLPIPATQFLANARLRSATNDLQDSSTTGNLEKVRSVLDAWRGDPSLRDPSTKDMEMSLVLAAQNGKGDVVRLFLEEGVPVGVTAPKLAKREGDVAIEVFQAFLDHGWDINSFDRIPALQYIFPSPRLKERN